jgi:D-alanyl-D-alanine carboxypeptidase/D-alanyl-D-alanine-endopeptidase (penicillin-binding protein 4)
LTQLVHVSQIKTTSHDEMTLADGRPGASCMKLSRVVLSTGLVAAALLTWAGRPGLQAQVSVLDDGAYRGYLAMRVREDGTREVLDEGNADRYFVPASVLKVVTVAAALEHLGGEYRWLTRLTSSGIVNGDVLAGDLVVEPGADPTWHEGGFDAATGAPLDALARQIRARGLTRIGGDLVVDVSRFPGRAHPTDRTMGDLPYRVGTPPAAFAVDEATVTVRVGPGPAVGEPASVTAPDDVEVLNHTTTVGPERHGAGTLDFVPLWGTDTLLLRGEYPISESPFVVAASDPSPERRAGVRLRAALLRAGVAIDGVVRLQPRARPGADRNVVLAEIRSRPLTDILRTIFVDSHNWYADMLTLTLAREVAGTGRFEDGVKVIADFASGVSSSDAIAPRHPWLRDGSGLSSGNLVTPRTVVGVLAYALDQPWGQVVLDSLARPGVGTLTGWPRLPAIAAKTGTLSHTLGLAGVFDPGARVIFCYFVNHHADRPESARREIASALERWRTVRRPQ